MSLIDLSHTFTSSMPIYPGDDKVVLDEVATIKKDGYTNHNLKSGMHVGTHIDAPLHFIPDGKRISEISINQFYGQGKLIDVRGVAAVDVDNVENVLISPEDIVLFFTGHDQFYGKHDYFLDHSVLTLQLAQYLIDKKIKMIGVDMPSPDKYPFHVHKLLLQHDILILENLTNLNMLLNKAFELFAFPIKFETDAAFVRTIAKTA